MPSHITRRSFIAGTAALSLTAPNVLGADRTKPGLRAGAAETVVTPDKGTPLAGPGIPSEGTHDDLFARVLVLDDGSKRLIVATLDYLGFDFAYTKMRNPRIYDLGMPRRDKPYDRLKMPRFGFTPDEALALRREAAPAANSAALLGLFAVPEDHGIQPVAADVAGVALRLKTHQRESVAWMLERELAGTRDCVSLRGKGSTFPKACSGKGSANSKDCHRSGTCASSSTLTNSSLTLI